MNKAFFLTFVILIGCMNHLYAGSEPYAAEWRRADSLLEAGFPQSAEIVIRDVYRKAKSEKQDVQIIKAQLYLLKATTAHQENGDSGYIAFAIREAATTGAPYDALWHSIAAELYWKYYQNNRWRILQRSSLADRGDQDFSLWSADRFYQEVSQHYVRSVHDAKRLQQIDITTVDPLLIKGERTEHLRPTLYDLLVFRAIEFFQNEEKELTRPVFRFTIDDPAAFYAPSHFVKHVFTTRDTSSLHFHALKLYQAILAFHAEDEKLDAWMDADLQRLQFVYDYSVLPNKKDLYIGALAAMAERFPDEPAAAMASYRIAEILSEGTSADARIAQRTRPTRNLPDVCMRLKQIMERFPDSEAGVLAKGKLIEISRHELRVQTEDVLLPGIASRVLLTYRNAPTAYFRIVKIDCDSSINVIRQDEKAVNHLLAEPALHTWAVSLPGTADMEEHTTEIMVDALPQGCYALIVSEREGARAPGEPTQVAGFQVSQLSIVTASPRDASGSYGYLLDRQSGVPIAHAPITFWERRYDRKTYSYHYRKASETISDSDGSFTFPGTHSVRVIARHQDHMLYQDGAFYDRQGQKEQYVQTRTFFFTDRSLYRPGQTIWFKGIIVASDSNGRSNRVLSGHKTEVLFYDVNGEVIHKQSLTSNEYGSVQGSFTAPESGLAGQMRISNGSGDCYVSVEAYKRPTFQVLFDTLKQAHTLHETVPITVHAQSFSGVPVDGATVSYRVVRITRFPYRWMFYGFDFPPPSENEITHGVVTTGSDGKAEILFDALPDPTVDSATQAIFTYTVYADITDVNGETRSGSHALVIGYRSLQIISTVPERAQPQQLSDLSITTHNLNGDFVAASVRLRIQPLEVPSVYYRPRLWAQPDQYVMNEQEFRRYFPTDVYRDEGSPATWQPQGDPVLDRSWETTPHGSIKIPASVWKKGGWYLMELEATDPAGRMVREKRYIEVFNPNGKRQKPYAKLTVTDGAVWQPGQQARVWLAAGMGEMNWIRRSQSSGAQERAVVQTSNGRPSEWVAVVSEQDRGGINLSWIGVRDNRVYEEMVFLPVPWTNKELNIEWETHRDKLEPGAEETWTFTIRGDRKEAVAAEMVATLYDASLDMFKPHSWTIPNLYPHNYRYTGWTKYGFGTSVGFGVGATQGISEAVWHKRYDRLMNIGPTDYFLFTRSKATFSAADGVVHKEQVLYSDMEVADPIPEDVPHDAMVATTEHSPMEMRTNLNETVFFMPEIRTDQQGNIRMTFRMPEALTEWKLLAVAHTRDMRLGTFEGRVKTQKDLMVVPGLPRFLRQGDKVVINARINNQSDRALVGAARLELRDALTGREIALPFRLQQAEQPFSITEGGSTSVFWEIHVPESLYQPVTVAISARSGNFTDGEAHTLPVISNRMLVTETLPLWMNGFGSKEFRFGKLLESTGSNTLSQHRLTVEFTGNPAWYVVQALPYLSEYPYDCAEQVFNRYYANALAAHIVDKTPKVKAIFDAWKTEDTAALLSNLEKNQKLKTALLEETPWVLDARSETAQKRRIALLFEANKLSRHLEASSSKLSAMVMPEGAFPWFSGSSHPDRYITQYITTGIGRMHRLGIETRHLEQIPDRTIDWLDRQILQDYKRLQQSKANMQQRQIGVLQIQYLYMRSFFPKRQIANKEIRDAVAYYRKQAGDYWSSFNPYMKGMIALALHRGDEDRKAATIIRSLRETAIHNEERGIYWLQPGQSWWWYAAPIEAQALLIECFDEVTGDTAFIDGMRLWLLKQKQTQNWRTTKATADACYAFLLQGTQWLTYMPDVKMQLGDKEIHSTSQQQQAGTGYFKTAYDRTEINANMGNIMLTVAPGTATAPANPSSYGAVYWQYFEHLDKITPAATPLVVRKQLFVSRNTDRGPVLEPVVDGMKLRVGDKLISRIEVVADRDMEYVHLKDMRAAGVEPVNVLSGYRWQGGLGYYEHTGDVASSFFISYLRQGKYVFEYPMFVTNKGAFSVGIATIQCLYAPEFASHSEGLRIEVE